MMLEIPINCDSTYFIQTTSLEFIAYQFEFIWNDRDERWRMSILDMQDNYIIRNIKLMPQIPLVRRYNIKDLFLGELFISSLPTRTNLGIESKLYYVSKDELERI